MSIGLIDFGSESNIKRLRDMYPKMSVSVPHLGLAYVAGVLDSNGYQIHMLDTNHAVKADFEKFLSNKYDIIGFSATTFTFDKTREFAREIRSHSKEAITVIGGPHAAVGMETVLNTPYFDYAVYGEGEFTMLDLVRLLEKSRKPKSEDLYGIKGLIFRDKGKAVVSPQRQRINCLDELPFPAFHLLPMKHYGVYPLLTSRGCPFGCSFCSTKAIWGTPWKFRSPKNIVEEIEYAINRYDWKRKPFIIVDDSFNVKQDRISRFCDILSEKGLNIQWSCAGFRADRISFPLAVKMKKTGCVAVSVGIESSSNDVLKRIKKKETIEDITRGCRFLVEAGIPVRAQFMIGNPGDTFETVMESIEYAKKQNFSDVNFYLALPYPKTELWEDIRKEGRFLREDYTTFHHYANEPVFETPEFTAEERKKAFALAHKFAVRTKLCEDIKTKLRRIRRLDFADLNAQRVAQASIRMKKYFLDYVFRRDETF